MSWNRYIQAHAEGIDEVEDEVDRTWAAALALLLLWERRLRAQTGDLLGTLPQRGGRWDTSHPPTMRRFRRRLSNIIEGSIEELSWRIAGTRSPITPGPIPRRGAQWDGMNRSQRAWERSWRESGRRLITDIKRLPPGSDGSRGPGGGPPLPPGDSPEPLLTPDQKQINRLKLILGVAEKSGFNDEDMRELRADGIENILRWLRQETRRFGEQVVRLTNRWTPTSEVGLSNQEWQIHRGNLRLSTTAHLRAVHRRATIGAADALGIQHFMVTVPRRRFGKIAAEGMLGRQLWRVRTLEEWSEVQRQANKGRRSSSSFDTLGLGYGDVSYLVPVPWIYRAAAIAFGLQLRKKHLEKQREERRLRAA